MNEPLCPACGRAPQTDERTGWCEACALRRRLERYNERTRREATERHDAWAARALEARRAWDAERQHRHRLLERVRPRRPAPRGLDPLEIADAALHALEALRPAAARSESHELLEEVAEALRQLAWGPEGDELADRIASGEADPAEHAGALERWSAEAEDDA